MPAKTKSKKSVSIKLTPAELATLLHALERALDCGVCADNSCIRCRKFLRLKRKQTPKPLRRE
jgi:hypothetical protein